MKITILNGSPRVNRTSAMIDAFTEGAKAAGHEVTTFQVSKMNIHDCLGCEYCHMKGNGTCILKDDMTQVLAAANDCDLIVFATPVYYRGLTACLTATIHRFYCVGLLKNPKKAALLVTSHNSGTTKSVEAYYHDLLDLIQLQDIGIFRTSEEAGDLDATLEKLRAFAKNL